jgi:two-component system NtrC family response regulator
MNKILIVDDDNALRLTIEKFLQENGFQTIGASNGNQAKEILKNNIIDVLITDLKLPDIDGISLLKFAKDFDEEIEVIVITAYGTVQNAVYAMKLGAFDYVTKPVELDELLFRIQKIMEKQQLRNKTHTLEIELSRKNIPGKLIYKSKKMKQVIAQAKLAAQSDTNVVLEGESGTGKELLAKLIHNESPRRKKPFIPIDCGAIPDSLLESELFGFVKGAFTGAISHRKGLLEEANGGTLFLDEISNTSFALQSKILRVIQDKQIRYLGSNTLVDIDVRFISATNKNLEQLVKEGKFREDLFFRLNVFQIKIPPLRERTEDIIPLANFFVEHYAKTFGKTDIKISEQAQNLLLSYNWPGNVRELQNAIERATLLCKDNIIKPQDLPIKLATEKEQLIEEGLNNNMSLEELEKKYIIVSLGKFKGDKTKTARYLKIGRNTLWRKLQKYGK